MSGCEFTDKKKECLLLAFSFWGVQIFIEVFAHAFFEKLFTRELFIKYIDAIFYGTFFILVLIFFRKILFNVIKDFVQDYEKYLKWSTVFVFITLIFMVVSAIVLDYAGVGESSNQEAINESIVQNGLLQIITVCFVGPVVEEVFYRGILFEVFQGEKNRVVRSIVAIFLSAMFFALMHVSLEEFGVNELLANIPIFLLGLTLATLRWKTDNIFCSVLVHIVINSIGTFG